MLKLIMKRTAYTVFSLWIAITIVFLLMNLTPYGEIDEYPYIRDLKMSFVSSMQYNSPNQPKSIIVRYERYMKNILLHGDLGESQCYIGRQVKNTIIKYILPSVAIILISIIISIVLGIIIGAVAGTSKKAWVQFIYKVIICIGCYIPIFITAMFLQYEITMKHKWLPNVGRGSIKNIIMPILSVSIFGIANICKMVKEFYDEIECRNYILTEKAKGASDSRIFRKYILKDIILLVVEQIPSQIVLYGIVMICIEPICNIVGLGSYFFTSVLDRDYVMIMGIIIFQIFVFYMFELMINIILDIKKYRRYEN